MIKLDTTFVVGAGASFDYNFPLGEELTRQIADALNFSTNGDAPARELIRTAIDVIGQRSDDDRRNPRELFLQAKALQAALTTAPSIDTFLENHPDARDFTLLGKVAIAACLITAEGRSELKQRHPGEMIDLSRVQDTWLARLFRNVLAPGISKASVEQIFANVSFVVFNYDRCIEHYFEQAIASHFMLDLPTAARIVQSLRIVHPYGDLGDLHGPDLIVPFGSAFTPGTYQGGEGIYQMSRRLLTFTESVKAGAEGAKAKDMISRAKRLVFLGFGFGEQNVDLLRVPTSVVEHVRGTVKGLSKSNQVEVRQRIAQMLGNRHHIGGGILLGALDSNTDSLHECNCTQLIGDEQMFLTRST